LPYDVIRQVEENIIPLVKEYLPCIPDDKNIDYYNGVHNTLANVFQLFEVYKADDPKIANDNKVGWLGILQAPEGTVEAYNETGKYTSYRKDYVSHIYVILENDRIAHSTSEGKKNGFIEERIPTHFINKIIYFLMLQLPENRKK
jgi:hypothetical protein